MTSTVAQNTLSGAGIAQVNDCHPRSNNAGNPNPQFPDLESLNSQQQVHHALTPPPQLPSSPWTISDTNNHCLRLSEKLRIQREQSRFADLILSVQGREFPAHRCVLAACSTWFENKLKVHKITREHIQIDECKDYEIFYAMLTFCYTGHIVLNEANVPELLHLSNAYGMMKLKSYCCEYLGRHLSVKTVHSVLVQALKYQLPDLTKQALSFIQRHFGYLLHHQRSELIDYSYNTVQFFLMEKAWSLPQELVLKFIVTWVNADLQNREDFLIQLLDVINWPSMNNAFLTEHVDNEPIYNSPSALYTILHILERNGVYLNQKYQEIYQNLQAEQELDELNDSNSFLTLAINSAVKTLEHSEVDPDWFLQGEGHPLPEQILTSSGTSLVLPQASTLSQRQERLERYKDSFDLDIFDQVMNEQQQIADERQKFSASKRYDPKYRALTEAIRLMEEEEEDVGDDVADGDGEAADDGECLMPPPATSPICYPPHPKQRHLSNSLAFATPPTSSTSTTTAVGSQTSQRTDLVVRNDSLSTAGEYMTAIAPNHRNDVLPPENLYNNSPSQRIELGVRHDALSGSFMSTSQTQRIDLGVRHDGMTNDYLPTSHRTDLSIRSDGMSADYLPNTPTIVPDVQFEASSLIVDYADFIVSEVATPEVGIESETDVKFFTQRQYEHQPHPVLGNSSSSGVSSNENNSCQVLQQQSHQSEHDLNHRQHHHLHQRVQQQQPDQHLHLQQREDQQQIQTPKQEQFQDLDSITDEEVYAVEGKKQKASKLQRLSSMQAEETSESVPPDKWTSDVVSDGTATLTTSDVATLRTADAMTLTTEVVTLSSSTLKTEACVMSAELTPASKTLPVATLCNAASVMTVTQNRHVKKAKLLAEHRKNAESALLGVKMSNENPKARSKKQKLCCDYCSFATRTKSRMIEHRRSHDSSSTSVSSVCPLCEFQTVWRYELVDHIKKTHGGPPFVCNICQYSSKKAYQLLTHCQIHSSNATFKCDTPGCDFVATTTHKLKFHKQSKHRNETFDCLECGKSFVTKQSHRTHQLVHISDKLSKSFSCDQCDFKTNYSSHLSQHKKIHRGEVYRCSVDPACTYATPKMVHLKNHEKAHRGEKSFRCEACDRAFVEKSQLSRHLKTHTDEMPFACTKCKFRTKRKDKLKNHLVKIHKETM